VETTATVEQKDTTAGSEILVRVRTFITSNFYFSPGQTLGDDASLLDQGLIDSTGVLEVVSFIEEAFGISVEDREMVPDNFDSVARICAFVQRKVAN
jgi:acyl carrier protein